MESGRVGGDVPRPFLGPLCPAPGQEESRDMSARRVTMPFFWFSMPFCGQPTPSLMLERSKPL
jgi:hypothetical protein